MEKTKGTYVAVEFSDSTIKLFNDILKEFGLEKDFNDKFHCTLVYSKKKLNWFKTSKGDKEKSEVNKLVKIKGFGHFDTQEGKNLHVILDCPYCKAEFERAMKAGATFDYDKYTAHVTLMYDCKDFTYSNQGEKFIGNKVLITNEYIEDLNLDWLDEKVKKDKIPVVEESSLPDEILGSSSNSSYKVKDHMDEFLNSLKKANHTTPGSTTFSDSVHKFINDNKKISEEPQEKFINPADAVAKHIHEYNK